MFLFMLFFKFQENMEKEKNQKRTEAMKLQHEHKAQIVSCNCYNNSSDMNNNV